MMEAIKVADPDEIYNMAASSYVSTAFEQPVGNAEITGLAVAKLLETIRTLNPNLRFYQTSSSEMFGNSNSTMQNENTHFEPAWGYAPEYMEAIYLILHHDKPDDFVISTGKSYSVMDFAKLAFELTGLDWKKYVKTDKRFRPLDTNYLRGDHKKAKTKLKRTPKVTFKELVKIMLDEDMKRWKLFMDGKSFP